MCESVNRVSYDAVDYPSNRGLGMRKLWGRKSSSNVQAVRWCLEVLGLEYEQCDAGFHYGVVDTDEYQAINPNRTVPTLQEDGQSSLWESGAIMRYLASQYAPDSFWPANPRERSIVDQWAEWSKINIALGFTAPVFWQVVRTAPSRQDPVIIAENLKTLDRFLSIANQQLSGSEFLAGDDITLADIQFGHVLYRYFDINIERTDHPSIKRYYDTLVEREDFQRCVIVNYDELRVLDD